MRFYFLLPVLAICLLPSNSLAQSERYPSTTEIETLIREMRQEIPKLKQSGFYNDRRTDEERRQREELVKNRSEIDSDIAPYLGNWAAIEENLAIFPLPNKGEVCILDSSLDITEFYLGRIIDGNLHTDNNLVLVLDSVFLVSTFVSDNRAGRYEYANPRPLDNPTTSSYYSEYHPEVVEQFQQAGCLIE